MSDTHSLANKKNLTWEDLRQEQICLGCGPGPELRNHLIARLKTSGKIPAINQHNVSIDFSFSILGIEPHITQLYEADAGGCRPGVIYREVSDDKGPCLVSSYACWLHDSDNPALQHFLDLLLRYQSDHT